MKLQHFLLTALILFTGVSGVYAAKHYVGFSSAPGGATNHSKAQLKTVLGTAGSGDTVFVAAGLYLADTTTAVGELIVPVNVTLIGGYEKTGAATLTRRYPGQFVPFKSSELDTNEFTILDGNSYMRTLPSKKHRVITVNAGGVVDGCLIRNGHVRNGNGGGVLLNGGKLYNSIVRGNVAMSKPDTIESLGGGVFIQNGGELINCLVAYNMANDGYGVAAGQGGGKMINNTITANTYSPVFAKIPATAGTFQMYAGGEVYFRPSGNIPKYNAQITLDAFYVSRTLTTQGQYAVFCAAMDIPKSGNYGKIDVTTLKGLTDPIKGSGTVGTRYGFSDANLQNILVVTTDKASAGLNYGDGVWYPVGDTSTVEYPMGNAYWHGTLAYSVWLGGGLPTEAQWQFAARCNPDGTASDNLYSGAYGSTAQSSINAGATDNLDTVTWRILDTIAWVNPTTSIDTATGKLGATWSNRPHEVARKRPNAMGIYDMAGNVRVYCGDEYNTTPTYSGTGTPTDPMEAGTGTTNRTVKGGMISSGLRADFSIASRLASSGVGGTTGVRPVVAFD